MKNILVLGGTSFIGRSLVEELIKTDNEITLFNRGKTNSELFPDLKKIYGDRETNDIKQIYEQNWDVIFDISSYYPLTLKDQIENLKGKIGKYIYVSSVSSFLNFENTNDDLIDENVEILTCTDEQKTDKSMSTYGNRKAECERVLLEFDWLNKVILRPSVVYGKYDPTDRLYYWLYRVKTQPEIIVPEDYAERINSYTFVEDLAKIMIKAMDKDNLSDTYNVITHEPTTLKEILDVSSDITGNSPKRIKASLEFLKKENVQSFQDLPLWIEDFDLIYDNSKLRNDFEIEFESFSESIKKTIDYYETLGWNEGKYGLSVAKEKELIKKL